MRKHRLPGGIIVMIPETPEEREMSQRAPSPERSERSKRSAEQTEQTEQAPLDPPASAVAPPTGDGSPAESPKSAGDGAPDDGEVSAAGTVELMLLTMPFGELEGSQIALLERTVESWSQEQRAAAVNWAQHMENDEPMEKPACVKLLEHELIKAMPQHKGSDDTPELDPDGFGAREALRFTLQKQREGMEHAIGLLLDYLGELDRSLNQPEIYSRIPKLAEVVAAHARGALEAIGRSRAGAPPSPGLHSDPNHEINER